jgi:hypothetical protein
MLIMGFVVLLVGVASFGLAQNKRDFSQVSFSSSASTLNFFDHSSGTVYIYASNGRLRDVWVIDELGNRLRQSRRQQQAY